MAFEAIASTNSATPASPLVYWLRNTNRRDPLCFWGRSTTVSVIHSPKNENRRLVLSATPWASLGRPDAVEKGPRCPSPEALEAYT